MYIIQKEQEEREKKNGEIYKYVFCYSFSFGLYTAMIHEELKKTIKDIFYVTVIPSRVVVVITFWNINNNNSSLIACVCDIQDKKQFES